MSNGNLMDYDLDDYVLVAERMAAFWRDHPNGRIVPTVIEHNLKRGFILIRSEVFDERTDTLPSAVGHASEFRDSSGLNWTSHIENCETSANGRALANRGYAIDRGIASREEMQKVERHQAASNYYPPIASGSAEAIRQPVNRQRQPEVDRDWQARNGKAILVLQDNEREPEQVPCPIHPGKTLKRREKDNESWLSHKDGQDRDGRDVYCSASFGRVPRPQAQAGALVAQLAHHNNRGRTN